MQMLENELYNALSVIVYEYKNKKTYCHFYFDYPVIKTEKIQIMNHLFLKLLMPYCL